MTVDLVVICRLILLSWFCKILLACACVWWVDWIWMSSDERRIRWLYHLSRHVARIECAILFIGPSVVYRLIDCTGIDSMNECADHLTSMCFHMGMRRWSRSVCRGIDVEAMPTFWTSACNCRKVMNDPKVLMEDLSGVTKSSDTLDDYPLWGVLVSLLAAGDASRSS